MEWILPILVTRDTEPTSLKILSDLDSFLDAFNRFFKNPHELEEAVNKLLDLKQTTSVEAYYPKFKNLLVKSKFDPFSAITIFRRGLKPAIRKKLEDKVYPSDFDQFAREVCELDYRHNQNKTWEGSSLDLKVSKGQMPWPSQFQQPRQTGSGYREPAPMDVDMVKLPDLKDLNKKLSDKEKRALASKGYEDNQKKSDASESSRS